jgi:nitrate reductase assembly molybdenum cofactor insertion protein NarJ
MIETMLDARVRPLLREAASWRLLGRLFECPAAGWHADVEALARELHDPELSAAAAAASTATEGQYHSVFGPGGPAPPREASHSDRVELGSLMSELTVCYAAFGYAPDIEEPPDHVAVETGFVAYLTLKEAYALAAGDEERAAIAAGAATAFLRDHLARIAEPLARRLEGSAIEYLVRAARLLARRVGPAPQAALLPVISEPADGEGSEFECGVP